MSEQSLDASSSVDLVHIPHVMAAMGPESEVVMEPENDLEPADAAGGSNPAVRPGPRRVMSESEMKRRMEQAASSDGNTFFLRHVRLDQLDLRGMPLLNMVIQDCTFHAITLDRPLLEKLAQTVHASHEHGIEMDGLRMIAVDMTAERYHFGRQVLEFPHVGIPDSVIHEVSIKTDFSGLCMPNSYFEQCVFDGVECSGMHLESSRFVQCTFRDSILHNVHFEQCRFEGCRFEGHTSLKGAYFSQASFDALTRITASQLKDARNVEELSGISHETLEDIMELRRKQDVLHFLWGKIINLFYEVDDSNQLTPPPSKSMSSSVTPLPIASGDATAGPSSGA